MPAAKDAHALVSYFVKQYKNLYGQEPLVNRHSARWGFDAMLMDLTLEQSKGLIDYYLTTTSPTRHNITWFFSNYEKLLESRADHEQDVEYRAKLRVESEKRAREWREKIGNKRTTDDKRSSQE